MLHIARLFLKISYQVILSSIICVYITSPLSQLRSINLNKFSNNDRLKSGISLIFNETEHCYIFISFCTVRCVLWSFFYRQPCVFLYWFIKWSFLYTSRFSPFNHKCLWVLPPKICFSQSVYLRLFFFFFFVTLDTQKAFPGPT